MTNEEFINLVESEHEASLEILFRKSLEYGSSSDRLQNFTRCAAFRNTNPADALLGMLVKHFESISEMAKDPLRYPIGLWDEKLRDIRNYTYLLKAIMVDMRKGMI